MNKIYKSNLKLIRYILIIIASLLTVGVVWLGYTSLPILFKILAALFTVIFPFVVSFLIAYIFHPLISILERKGYLKRIYTILAIYFFTFIVLGTLIVFVIIPFLKSELSPLVNQILDLSMIEKAKYNFLELLGESEFRETLEIYIDEFILKLRLSFASDSPSIILRFSNRIMSSFLNILLIPIVSFYMMKDFEKMMSFFKRAIIPKYRKTVVSLFVRIDEKIGAYIRSQLFLMTLISIAATIGYAIIGLPYFYIFAIIIGLTNVIPYIGAYIGLAPPVLFILATGDNFQLIIFVIIVNLILQMLEGNVLQPIIMGKNLDYNPLLIILSMLITSEFLGIIGIVFAVPILILVYETFKFIYEKKLMQYYVDIDYDVEMLLHDESDYTNIEKKKIKTNVTKKKILPKRSN